MEFKYGIKFFAHTPYYAPLYATVHSTAYLIMVHSSQQFIRKLTKSGKYTYYIVIPKTLIDSLHWRERQKLVVKKFGKGVAVRDWPLRKSHRKESSKTSSKKQ